MECKKRERKKISLLSAPVSDIREGVNFPWCPPVGSKIASTPTPQNHEKFIT